MNKEKKIKRTCRIVDFTLPVDHRVKIKESKKRDKYLDSARELRKAVEHAVTVIPLVIGIVGTVHKGLERWLDELEIGEYINAN